MELAIHAKPVYWKLTQVGVTNYGSRRDYSGLSDDGRSGVFDADPIPIRLHRDQA